VSPRYPLASYPRNDSTAPHGFADEPHAFIPRTADEVNPLDPGRYQVGGVTYVTWSDVPRCSCIDAQYHPGRCRHIALVRAYRAADSEGKAA